MAATPISAASRYYRKGTTKIYFLTAAADYTSPTRAEMDAGTDLSGEVADISGWQVTSAFVDTPDLASRFTSKIPGDINADDSSLNFYASSDSMDVRTLLPRDTTGFILILDEGDVTGHTMDVFPVTVGSAPKLRTLTDPAMLQVNFAITAVPAENVTIPA